MHEELKRDDGAAFVLVSASASGAAAVEGYCEVGPVVEKDGLDWVESRMFPHDVYLQTGKDDWTSE